jgi:hypothetical protein
MPIRADWYNRGILKTEGELMLRKIILALLVCAASFVVTPAGATECTPKGCTGGCHLTPPTIDIENGHIIGGTFECYS